MFADAPWFSDLPDIQPNRDQASTPWWPELLLWVGLVLLILLFAIWFIAWLWRRKPAIPKTRPTPSSDLREPAERALLSLRKLNPIETLQNQQQKRRYLESLSTIVREYIQLTTLQPVWSRTTQELQQRITIKPKDWPELSEFLQQSDLGKFASLSLTPKRLSNWHQHLVEYFEKQRKTGR